MSALNDNPSRILMLGIGNSSRSDDGLGWKFVDVISEQECPFMDYEFRYQLQVEDAALVADYDVVVFVDATQELLNDGFKMESCRAAHHYAFSSHAQDPNVILYLANTLYNKFPKAYILAIGGVEWELKTQLSDRGWENLQSALSYFTSSFLPAVQPDIIFRQMPFEVDDLV